eukprot:TRINITY_DN1523_c0_g1_i1.p1 TRINITY_DN1523_c0_g1~~TRINITY_DN1523_c0_g1_i1.p1  ORF type:complete len:616 (+),score=219.09 TRINITY_DN1523_c0_g1_i1:74-1921(+)
MYGKGPKGPGPAYGPRPGGQPVAFVPYSKGQGPGSGLQPFAPMMFAKGGKFAGGAMAKGKGAPPGQRPPALTPSASAEAPPVLPFGLPKVRGPAEHSRRNHHRSSCPPNLLQVTAHWAEGAADGSVSKLLSANVLPNHENKEYLAPYTPTEEQGVDIRILPVLGLKPEDPDDRRHVVRRLECLLCSKRVEPPEGKPGKPSDIVVAYGGVVKEAGEPAMKKAAAAQIKRQCGLDLTASAARWRKLVEFEYKAAADEKGASKVIFYIPPTDGELQLRSQVREEMIEIEVEEEVKTAEEEDKKEEVEDAMLDDDTAEQKPKKAPKPLAKKVKVKKEVLRKTPVATPRRVALGNMLSGALPDKPPRDTVETAMALDALDEMLQREYAQRIHDFLVTAPERVKVSAAEEESVKAWKTGIHDQIKEKRKLFAEAEAEQRKKRKEKEDQLRELWRKEDDGLTDDEKRAEMKYRFRDCGGTMALFFQALWKDEADELSKKKKETSEEIAELEKELGTVVMVPVRDDAALEAFQWFDRSSGFMNKGTGTISRAHLEGLLMCLPKPLTLRAAGELIDAALPEALRALKTINYMHICSVQRRKELAQETKEKADEAESKKKDATKD